MTCLEFTTEELASEIWKPIPEYVGYYSASSLGRIRRDKGGAGHRADYILKPHESKGYMRLFLRRDTIGRNHSVHRLIAAAFIGPCPSGLQVNHVDGCKMNNRADNLEYVTAKENKIHAVGLGLVATGLRNGRHTHPERVPRGENHYKRTHPEKIARGATLNHSDLTDDSVREIKRLLADGVKGKDIAKKFNVTPANISSIKKNKTWTHVSLEN